MMIRYIFINLTKRLQITSPKPHSYNTVCLQSGILFTWGDTWSSIKIGFYYANKVDNFYYANLIVKLCKKHLNIKDITTTEVLKDLYSSTKFGPYYYYRIIKGFLDTSIFFSMVNRLFWGSGLLIYLNRNPNLNVDLSKYKMDWNQISNILFEWDLPGNFSALNVVEIVFLTSMLLKIFRLLLIWYTLSDRRVSIYHTKSNLLPKLNPKQRFYFFIGVVMFSLLSRLGVFSRILIYYLIVSNLNIIPSFIQIPAIFVFVENILNLFLNSCGFTQESPYPLDRLVNKMTKIYANFALKDQFNDLMSSISINFSKFKLGNWIESIIKWFKQ